MTENFALSKGLVLKFESELKFMQVERVWVSVAKITCISKHREQFIRMSRHYLGNVLKLYKAGHCYCMVSWCMLIQLARPENISLWQRGKQYSLYQNDKLCSILTMMTIIHTKPTASVSMKLPNGNGHFVSPFQR